ncbi:replication protein [Aeromonas hydrophila]|uniref:replication protein n=1 Tax=Aeromonas hydrophila TaxID=644 RepID=UPI00235E3947|nr:replication protein [Aeromonas hydrophila]
MNTVLKFPEWRPQCVPQEVRVADLDDGYTRIANELYEALIGADLTRNQAKVAHAIARKTYGFNKSRDRICDSQLGELTGLPRQKVNKAKNELITMGVLVMQGREIGLNKVISEWKTQCHQNSDTVTKTVTKSVTKTVTRVSPKQGHTKDTIQKTRKTKHQNTCAEPVVADSTPEVIELVGGSPQATLQPPSSLPAIPDEPVAIELTLNTGAQYPVTEAFASQMQSLYPAVNVAQELRAMCGWLLANPAKRKTKTGITRFINSWLAKCQDRGGQNGLAGYAPRGGHTDLTQTMTADELNRRLQEGF